MLELKIKRLSDTAKLPQKSHSTDACFDIYADVQSMYFDTVVIEPHSTLKIPAGFATNIPHGYWAAVFARSGLATKQGLRPANCVAVIDEQYTGEWLVPLYNDSDTPRIVRQGDRIAQFTLLNYYDIEIIEVDKLDSTERGSNGFGSSGT